MSDNFCTKCGTALVDGSCPKCSQTPQNSNAEKFKRFFMNPKEQFVCALGNGYIQNFLANGYVGKGFAVTSDKRVYFNGKRYTVDGKKLRATTVASTVEIKDVTGMSIRTVKNLALKFLFILGVLLFTVGIVITIIVSVKDFDYFFPALASLAILGVPLCAPSIISYLTTKKTVFLIDYTRGCTALNVKWYSKEEIDSFQKMLLAARDKALKEGTNDTEHNKELPQELPIVEDDSKFKRFFMNPKEKCVCYLGNGYIQNYLASGFLEKGFAVVSDKRVYFNGKTYEVHNSRLKATSESRTVDLKDVTGTGVRAIKYPLLWILTIVATVLIITLVIIGALKEQEEFGLWNSVGSDIAMILGVALLPLPFYISYNFTKNKGYLISAFVLILAGMAGVMVFDILVAELPQAFFIFLLFMAIPAALLFSYFKTRKTILTISYAGGCIAFDINWYSKDESDGFQKMLRIAKDKAVEDAENATADAMREVMSNVVATPVQPVQSVQPQAPVSTADELIKYAQLYKDGLLSEEEFAAIKAKML